MQLAAFPSAGVSMHRHRVSSEGSHDEPAYAFCRHASPHVVNPRESRARRAGELSSSILGDIRGCRARWLAARRDEGGAVRLPGREGCSEGTRARGDWRVLNTPSRAGSECVARCRWWEGDPGERPRRRGWHRAMEHERNAQRGGHPRSDSKRSGRSIAVTPAHRSRCVCYHRSLVARFGRRSRILSVRVAWTRCYPGYRAESDTAGLGYRPQARMPGANVSFGHGLCGRTSWGRVRGGSAVHAKHGSSSERGWGSPAWTVKREEVQVARMGSAIRLCGRQTVGA
ncbi:hypothetical protein BD413DRAFT_592872 [Trametes elegans]|nr:hypothetical protein BD413DRAFT_592872 [Trametes elegans]